MSEPSIHPSHAGAMERDVPVVLLAGGAGSRFAGPRHKLLAELPASSDRAASTVFGRSLAIAWEAAIGPLLVVHGSLAGDALTDDGVTRDTLERAAASDGRRSIQFIHNDAWATGQASSLRVGIGAAQRLGAAAVVVGLADQPGVTVDAWRTVAAGSGAIVVAVYDGRRGNPVRLDRRIWGDLPPDGDEGARILMRQRPDLVTGVPCSGSPNDIDTVEDLHAWQSN